MSRVATPGVGTTYRLDESDYRYGSGPLFVRVNRVLDRVDYGGELWWQVEARCAVPGLAGPARDRTLYVRASALPSSDRWARDVPCAPDDPQ